MSAKPTVFLRHEPTTDPVFKGMDVVVYHDRECTQLFGIFRPWLSNRPNKRSRSVTINCFRWDAVWV